MQFKLEIILSDAMQFPACLKIGFMMWNNWEVAWMLITVCLAWLDLGC